MVRFLENILNYCHRRSRAETVGWSDKNRAALLADVCRSITAVTPPVGCMDPFLLREATAELCAEQLAVIEEILATLARWRRITSDATEEEVAGIDQ